MEKFSCLEQNILQHDIYTLQPLQKSQMETIRIWRNEQMPILRQRHVLSAQDQENYYEGVLHPLFQQENPEQLLFAFLKGDTMIAYGGLTHLDWQAKKAELSILFGTERAGDSPEYRRDFYAYLTLLQRVLKQIKFLRLWAETYDLRPYHLDVMEAFGFEFEGRLRQHNYIEGKLVDSILHGLLLN
jgi:RimJ/RimL family protein N-acetyltransferase